MAHGSTHQPPEIAGPADGAVAPRAGRLKTMAAAMVCVIGLASLFATGALTRLAGIFLLGALIVIAIPVVGFTCNQMALTNKGREVATTTEEVRALKASDAAAFRTVADAVRRFPRWLVEVVPPMIPQPAVADGQPDSMELLRAFSAGPVVAQVGPRPGEGGGFWRSLTVLEQRALARVGRRRTFLRGAVLCREGHRADHVIVIETGWTKVSVHKDGDEHIIALRGPGDLIGERAALLVRSRSATVVALDTVRALLVPTADFVAFLDDHPRVMAVLEQELYGRLTEDGGRPIRPPGTPPWADQNCSIMLTDIVGFGGRHRDDKDRQIVRRVMYDVLEDAFERSQVPWPSVYREDRGDGTLIVIPPDTPTRLVVDPLVARVAARLRRHNQDAVDAVQMQLRVALHVGPVTPDSEGVSGAAIIHAARLLDAKALRRRLAETATHLGFIVSAYVYDNVVKHRPGHVDPANYQQVTFQAKESRVTAWMHLA